MHPAIIIGIVRSLIVDVAMGQNVFLVSNQFQKVIFDFDFKSHFECMILVPNHFSCDLSEQ